MNYNQTFCNHVIRLLNERNLSKTDFASQAGISISFLSDLTNEKANPSLKVMCAIADALMVPLPLLLKNIDCEEWTAIRSIANFTREESVGTPEKKIPAGYEEVRAVLPSQKAYLVKKWASEGSRKRRKA